MSKPEGGWLSPAKIIDTSYERALNMTSASIDVLRKSDPEYANHLLDEYGDVILLNDLKVWGGFSTLEETRAFMEASDSGPINPELFKNK